MNYTTTVTLLKMLVSRMVGLPDATNRPIVILLFIMTVLVLIVLQEIPLVDRAAAKLFPVRTIRSQQFGGVWDVEVLVVNDELVVVLRTSRMLKFPKPVRHTPTNFEPVELDSRIITPASDELNVPFWLLS
jgi:hypothetical protein